MKSVTPGERTIWTSQTLKPDNSEKETSKTMTNLEKENPGKDNSQQEDLTTDSS